MAIWIGALCLGIWLGVLGLSLYGLRSIPRLEDLHLGADAERQEWPTVRIVVAAGDEEAEIETAIRSLLAIEYPHLEIVAVDDRSTDGTNAILQRVAAENPRLVVRRIEELPEGWLGKNHALQVGAD